MNKGRLASIKTAGTATSGLASSLAFTPVQGAFRLITYRLYLCFDADPYDIFHRPRTHRPEQGASQGRGCQLFVVRRWSLHPCKEGEGNWKTFYLIACNSAVICPAVLRVMCWTGRLRAANGRPQLAGALLCPSRRSLHVSALVSYRARGRSHRLVLCTFIPPSSEAVPFASLASSFKHDSSPPPLCQLSQQHTLFSFAGRTQFSFPRSD